MHALLQSLETTLNDIFTKQVPWKLPLSVRKALAGSLWWIALILGVLQLWDAWGLWRIGHHTDELITWANSLARAYGDIPIIHHLGPSYYLALLVAALDAFLLLSAISGLKALRKARGWDFVFYSMLLGLAYSVLRIFAGTGSDFGQLIGALVWAAVGGYFLFQIRDQFSGTHPKKPAHEKE